MMELYTLTILYAAISGASSANVILGPNQYTRTGPMDQATCMAAATALNTISPTMFHASCERYPMMIMGSPN